MKSRFVLVFLCLLCLPTAALAAAINVACVGATTPGTFTSINDALNALPADGSQTNFIIVSGTCTENVTILNRHNVTITTPPNERATIIAADPNQLVFHLIASRGILIFNLDVNGGAGGILLNTSSQADIINSTFQGASGTGVGEQFGSTLSLNGVTVQNNGGDGIAISDGSNATLSFIAPDTFVRSLNNGGFGVNVDGSYLQSNGVLSVQGNGAAINAVGARLNLFGTDGAPGNVFRDNFGGFTLRGGTATFTGSNLIANNGDFGIVAIGATVNFVGPIGTTIENHGISGLFIDRGSNVTLNGPHKIRHNGSVTADPTTSSGVFVNMGGILLSTRAATITDNTGFGIGADQLGVVTIDAITVANNTREGVHLGHMSSGFFGPSLIFGGNGVAAITCDTTSHAFVDSPKDFTGTNCKNIQKK